MLQDSIVLRQTAQGVKNVDCVAVVCENNDFHRGFRGRCSVNESAKDTKSLPIKNKLIREVLFNFAVVPDSMVRVPKCHTI
jgi:hypothetical protein